MGDKKKAFRSMFRMSPEALQEYLKAKRNRAFAKKKGRGSYSRKGRKKEEAPDDE